MNIIGLVVINLFIEQHPDVRSSLNVWIKATSKARWKNIIEIRQIYSHADAVGTCTVFNIKGNHYRLITKINYRTQTVSIEKVLTHAEYDKAKWKKGCDR
ncbi:MAG: hypothetical protein AUG51_22345 [Acidobacteria bacterium 13_1_20CM_3_53_8]|nr:MAG: hypothetical protein AUG51_22345 [Acidobacteria bacterium 13_1_20CM_3_53_8]